MLQVVGDRIVINNNYTGLCIYDCKMNLLKKLKLIKGLLIHEAFVIDEQSMILYCYDNSLFIYVNCVNYKYKIIKIKKKQRKYNPKEVIFFDGKKCVFQAYERRYRNIKPCSEGTPEHREHAPASGCDIPGRCECDVG